MATRVSRMAYAEVQTTTSGESHATWNVKPACIFVQARVRTQQDWRLCWYLRRDALYGLELLLWLQQ